MHQRQPHHLGSVLTSVLAFAVGFVGVAPQASHAQSPCVTEIHDQTTGAFRDGGTDCQAAVSGKCLFQLALCVNQGTKCTPLDLKTKKIKATGHCGPVAKINVKPSGTSAVCGSPARITVRTKHKTKPGTCKLRVQAGKKGPVSRFTLLCQPPSGTCPSTTTTTTVGSTTTTTGPPQAAVPLGSAANFVVLAGSMVANTGATMVTGDLGVSPGSAVTGFPPGTVNGMTHAGDPTAAQAQMDLTTAFNDAAGRTVGAVSVSGNLGGLTLAPGLYKSTSSLAISSGDLTLDAQGNANAVFIFQMASTLTTTAGRHVILSGGAKASNIVWQVGSSATLGMNSIFKGNILADQSITLVTGATLDGRALTRIGAVTLDTNTITKPAP